MKQIIYNLSNIRAPLTGVGRYAIELIRKTQINRPNIAAIKDGNVHIGENLNTLLTCFDSHRATPLPQISVARQLRGFIGSVPFSRTVYRALDNHNFAKLSKPLIEQGASFHDLNYSLSPKNGHNVSTVYDLSNIMCPETHPAHRVRYLNSYFAKLRAGDCRIIAISHTIKSELVEYYGICENRIHVTHLAADNNFRPRAKDTCLTVLNEYAISYKKYVLCVGTLEPRKNLSAVLTAYESLDKQVQKEFPLVMAGSHGWKSSQLEGRINRLHKAGVVKQLGYVRQSDLPVLYAGAAVFIYPSLYEGFGLPLLEAMQSGCPCITSNTGALAEVSGEHAVQVDPRQSDDIAHKLNRLLREPDFNSYYSLSGQQRAKDFNWSKTAHKTSEIYDSL